MGTPLTELLGSPTAIGTVTNAIGAAVDASLKTHPCRHLTRAEVKRRFEICVKAFKEMRMERKFSIDRASSQLGQALRCALDGVPFEPHDRAVWRPEEPASGLVGPDGLPLARA